MDQNTLTLPNEVISPTDIARLTREIESLDEFFRQSAIREGGTPQAAPRYSRLLDGLVVTNELNLLQSDHREQLIGHMKKLSHDAPVLHISFSVDPPGAYVQKIVTWLRANIDGTILVRVGLQPNIGAGCVVRTTNKSFDFSLRRFFDSKKDFFAAKLHEVVSADATPVMVSKTADVTSEAQLETVVDQSNQDDEVIAEENEETIVGNSEELVGTVHAEANQTTSESQRIEVVS